MDTFLICIGIGMAISLGILLGLWMILSVICWIGDVFDNTTWRWKK